MFVEVSNRANYQATFLDKSWHDRVDLGAIVDKGWDRFAINQSLTDIFRSQPPVSGVLIPVGTGSIMGGSQFCTRAGGALGMWPPFAPEPPFGFNFFSFSRAFLSSSEFRANLRAGFNGFLVMPRVAQFTTIVALSEKSFALISCHCHSDVVRLILLHVIILSPTLDF